MAQSKYQYETSPRKVKTDYEKSKKKKLKVVENLPRQDVKVSKKQKRQQRKLIFTIVGIFLLVLTISCRNSQIDKKFDEIQEQKKELSSVQKENEQLKVNIENSLNLNNIEKVAKDELGMEKLTNKQTVYVTLPKKDYIESASEKITINENKNWLEKLMEKMWKE